MTFATFMDLALYGSGGYYAERPALGGAGADYFTAPELHPAFGALVGRQVAEVWDALGRPSSFDLVEHGPGSGALCRDLLLWADHEAPDFGAALRYLLVEPSAALRSAQRTTLAAAGLLDRRVAWEDPTPVRGCIVANELLDALPVHLVVVRDGRLRERYVTLEEDRLGFVEDEPSTPALAAYFGDLGLLPGEGCLAEVNLAAVAWARRAAGRLATGALLVLDYGYPAAELYASHRRYGTLLCYRGHALGSDPLVHFGEQDITTHVDFTSVARAGERAGLTTIGRADQATFLRNLGLREYLGMLDRAPIGALEHDANRRALLELVRADGLGAINVLMQARGLDGFRPSGLLGPSRLAPKLGDGFSCPPADSPERARSAWLPLLRAGQMRLPGPAEVEGFGDLEAQWRELWSAEESEP